MKLKVIVGVLAAATVVSAVSLAMNWNFDSQYTLFSSVDHAESVKRVRKAAEQGDAIAQNSLGLAYAKGEGVPQDDAKAVTWYRKAAEQGLADAQYNLDLILKKL